MYNICTLGYPGFKTLAIATYIQQVLYEFAFSVCGVERFRIINIAKSRTVLQPNCTLQEAGIAGDCVLIVEAVEYEGAPF